MPYIASFSLEQRTRTLAHLITSLLRINLDR